MFQQLFVFLISSLCIFQSVEAHAQPGMVALPSLECSGNNIEFLSYHIHILYWQNNLNSTNEAMSLRQNFMKAFNMDETVDECSFSPGQAMPEQQEICHFGVDTQPAGPFLTAQYSFFIPLNYFQAASAWAVAHRTFLDVFIHPNSGCDLQDHMHFGLWSGKVWEIDPSVFLG